MCADTMRVWQVDRASRTSSYGRPSWYSQAENVPGSRGNDKRLADAPLQLVRHDWAQLSWRYPVAFMSYRRIEPVLQTEYAQCGFVATAMAASTVGRRPNIQDMFNWAYRQGFTNVGDIFNISHLKALCDRYVRVPSTVMMFPSKEALIADLIRGKLFLVPYDAGYENGAPSLYNGHKAHWAVVLGALLMRPYCPPCISRLPRLAGNKPIYLSNNNVYLSHMYDGMDFVFAQHGWYAEPDLWSIETLRESCWQLNEVDPRNAASYVLPRGGIRQGLRGKVLRLDL
ncbi:hypothetical protein BIW11_12783 [Tropilaelaps mercedesae]|uniref:Actin maturation protease n=1 Tax=Tropilaelaps mercedesae TaxID=418985 RepID=A0A1V9X5T3_9ACAR|nr:hypothetical protein BIW11_12783 [Tropilaelaps mercedesae]